MPTHPDDRRRTLTSAALRCCLLLAALAVAAPAAAQLSASATLVSEYRYRGMALSDGRPAIQAGVAWDADSGWFAGLFAAQTRTDSAAGAHLMAYGGRAWRLDSGISWEAGVSASRLTALPGSGYSEIFTGIAAHAGAGQLSARVYFAPDYLGARTVYGELNGNWPLTDRFGVFAHGGMLRTLSGARYQAYRPRADLRAGLAAAIGAASLQLALEHAVRRSGYRRDRDSDDAQARTVIVAGIGWHF